MSKRISVRMNTALGFLFYAVASPLLTFFVSPNGISGVLFAYPLYCVTWLYGRKPGFVTAAIGIALNSLIWLLAGDGLPTISRSGASYVVVLCLVESMAFILFVLIVGNVRRREDQRREEIERSRDLLRVSELKYRSLIETAPEAISVLENGKVLFCNSRLLQMLGYSHDEMIGMDISQIVHEGDLCRARECHRARARGENVPTTILRDRRKNGDVIWVESVGQSIEWEGRTAVLYFTSDITERKRAQEALQESEERYRTTLRKYRDLVEVAPEAISVVENGKVIFCNSQLLEMFGCSREEMLGTDFTRFIYKDDVKDAMRRYAMRPHNTSLIQSTLRVQKRNGEVIWVKSVGKMINWEGRIAGLIFTSDITEKKRLEEQFVQAQKMEAIGRLAGGIAHDFNNLLQVILGFCSLAKSCPDDTNAVLSHLLLIEEAGQKAASLTQQLLAFSRRQVVQPKVFDLRDLVLQSKKLLSRVLGEDVELSVVQCHEESRIRADAGQLQQVIMNLALNARDAMPKGGKITIAVGTASLNNPVDNGISPGDSVRLSVSDTGHGMDDRIMAHLFEPFFTTKGLGRGTGLGLSTVYGIVKQCGGHIRVDSKVGHGSTFSIYLPRSLEPVTSGTKEIEKPGERGTESILLVEDESLVRSLVAMMLEMGGYTVTAAASGEEAITLCTAHQGEFDLLLTDMVLTGMRGTEVAENVRRFCPQIRVIYMTGYADGSDAPQHGSIVMQKPFSAFDLLVQVRSSLNPRGSASPDPPSRGDAILTLRPEPAEGRC